MFERTRNLLHYKASGKTRRVSISTLETLMQQLFHSNQNRERKLSVWMKKALKSIYNGMFGQELQRSPEKFSPLPSLPKKWALEQAIKGFVFLFKHLEALSGKAVEGTTHNTVQAVFTLWFSRHAKTSIFNLIKKPDHFNLTRVFALYSDVLQVILPTYHPQAKGLM